MIYQNIFAGILLIATGAFSSGSFAIPFGKIKDWRWESYWLVYSFGAYILFPVLACLIFAPGFMNIYKDVPAGILLRVFLLGQFMVLETYHLAYPYAIWVFPWDTHYRWD